MQLDATRQAITSLRAVAGSPVPRESFTPTVPPEVGKRGRKPAKVKPVARARKPRSDAGDTPSVAKVRAYLKQGPSRVGPFQVEFGLSSYRSRVLLEQLQEQGVVAVTGVTAGRRIALAGAPAKEAP